jgi:hypothetical protein
MGDPNCSCIAYSNPTAQEKWGRIPIARRVSRFVAAVRRTRAPTPFLRNVDS